MHKNAMKCKETLSKWCKNKHGASNIMDTFETYQFPNPREVERAVYYGSSMKLKTVDATIRLSTWTASIGSKGCL
jgi:hypothetical protein